MNARTDRENRSPEHIEHEIELARAQLDHTLNALERKLSPTELVDQVRERLRGTGSGPSEFAANLRTTIMSNPVPVTLLSVALGWLMMADWEDRSRGYRGMSFDAGRKLKEGMERTSASTGYARDQAGAKAQSAGAQVSHATQGASERVSQAGREVHARAGQAVHEAGKRMDGMARDARLRVGETTDAARLQGERLRAGAYRQAARAKGSFNTLLEERPLALGAISLAIGAVLGATLPATRREDELMGRQRDKLLDQTKAAGEEQLHKAERVAEAAKSAAHEEAERQNLTPETARKAGEEQLRETEEKVGQVAKAAKEAAKEETERQDLGSSSSSSGPSGPGGTSSPSGGNV